MGMYCVLCCGAPGFIVKGSRREGGSFGVLPREGDWPPHHEFLWKAAQFGRLCLRKIWQNLSMSGQLSIGRQSADVWVPISGDPGTR